MKRICTLIYMISAFLFSGSLSICYAQLSSEGEWKATTINAITSPDTTTPVIRLTGDVTMKGSITVSSGYTLTIVNDSESPVTLSKKNNSSSTLFTVSDGGCLIVQGSEGKEIIMDCGANLTWNDYTLTQSSPYYTCTDGIKNAGTLDLSYVTLQNYLFNSSYHGAINVTSVNGTTTLDHCTIAKCRSGAGAAIYLANSSATDPEATRVSVSNSTITQCITGNSATNNSGGAIRTLGSTVANLYLTNVTFSYNSSLRNPEFDNTLKKSANGGALFWNGRGHANTTCYIDGCLFEYNKCENNGGAIKAQGSLIFQNNKTIIRHNEAPYGAGIFIEGYTGGHGFLSNITYALNEHLEVTDNIATSYEFNGVNYPSKGGGIHFDFGSDMTLATNSTITVEMAGAIIKNNHVVGEGGLGGGIFYEDEAPTSKKYTFNINLNHGVVMQNTASGNGGGVYVSKGEVKSQKVEGNTLLVDQNVAALNGGGIYIKNGSLSLADGSITQNTLSGEGNGGGICIENGNFTIGAGEVSSNTVASGLGAGVYIVGSNGKGNFTMNGGEIKGNTTSSNNGGGVYINGGNFILNAGSITENESADGGGVYLNNGNFDLIDGEISNNVATGNGGGVYLIGENCIYKLKNGSILENEAENGGVYLANGSFILADSIEDQGSISKNTSTAYGGGVYIAGDGDFTMNGGTVVENSTSGEDGGGIYLNGGNFILNDGYIKDNAANSRGGGVYLYGGRFLMEDGVISGNLSRSDGGGACIVNNGDFIMNDGDITGNGKDKSGVALTMNGGGVFLDGGSLTVTAGNISSNASTDNGGGVYIMNGTVNMGAGMIKENHCGLYGGGVYVFNSSADTKTVNFNGGTMVGNTAMYGGGVCVDGRIDLNIGNVEIAENSATNGGGVCLMNNAFMNFGVGQIKNNTAAKQSSRVYNTAYGVAINAVEGVGGGVYLDSNTKLVFNYAENLGLFGNKADTGGNEIFANGDGTLVDLPDVTYMALGGYPGASNLKWIEDYPTNDPNYDKGTKLKGTVWDADKTNLRYEETISQNAYIYNLSGAVNQSEKYICFALGYEVIYITITRFGLKKGESAVYHLRKNDANDFKIIMTGDGSESITKRVAVTAGEWTIEETGWSWAYDITDENGTALTDRKLVRDIADEENRIFVFRGVPQTSLPLHHESISINIMGN